MNDCDAIKTPARDIITPVRRPAVTTTPRTTTSVRVPVATVIVLDHRDDSTTKDSGPSLRTGACRGQRDDADGADAER